MGVDIVLDVGLDIGVSAASLHVLARQADIQQLSEQPSARPSCKSQHKSRATTYIKFAKIMAADGKVVCMVTGGSGLYDMAIRAHVAQSAEEKDATWVFLSSKDGDLRDRKATEAIFERVRPTHVIHLAAMVGGLFANMSKKVEFYRENMLMYFISVSLRGREQQRVERARGTTRGR